MEGDHTYADGTQAQGQPHKTERNHAQRGGDTALLKLRTGTKPHARAERPQPPHSIMPPLNCRSPHIRGAVPREGAHGSRSSSTRKTLNPASYRGKSISAPSGPTRYGRRGLAGASTGHLRRGWEQAVSEARADARQ